MIQQFIWRHTRKSRMAKAILYKKSNAGYHHAWIQIILLSHHNKNSMILALSRHMDQWIMIENPDMRHATAVIWLWQRCWKYTMKKEWCFQQSVYGKLDFSMQNSEMRPLTFYLCKTQPHLDQEPQHKACYPQTARGKSRCSSTHGKR